VRIIQRSTSLVYADAGSSWLDEHAPTTANPVLASVQRAESIVSRHVRAGGAGLILRLGHLYGPSDSWTRRLVSLARRGWLPLDGPGDGYFPIVGVDDAVRAIELALDGPSGIFNVAEPIPPTIADLNAARAEAVGRAALHPLWPARTPTYHQLVQQSCRLDSSRFEQATGWRPRADPPGGFRSTLDAVAAGPQRSRRTATSDWRN
jgi:nucleoside-diphosphate-sugar epimerase